RGRGGQPADGGVEAQGQGVAVEPVGQAGGGRGGGAGGARARQGLGADQEGLGVVAVPGGPGAHHAGGGEHAVGGEGEGKALPEVQAVEAEVDGGGQGEGAILVVGEGAGRGHVGRAQVGEVGVTGPNPCRQDVAFARGRPQRLRGVEGHAVGHGQRVGGHG